MKNLKKNTYQYKQMCLYFYNIVINKDNRIYAEPVFSSINLNLIMNECFYSRKPITQLQT